MDYRLLVDLEAIAVLDSLSKKVRARLLDQFVGIRSAPNAYSDYHEHDDTGRRIEISVFAGYSLHYWIDFPDRHVKILLRSHRVDFLHPREICMARHGCDFEKLAGSNRSALQSKWPR